MRKEWQTVEKEIQTWEMNSYCTTQETTDQSELEFAVVNTWSVCWNWFDNKFCTMKSVKYFQKQWPNQPENLIFVRVFVAMHGKLWSHWNVCIKHAKKNTHEKSTIKCWISSNKIGCSSMHQEKNLTCPNECSLCNKSVRIIELLICG